VVRIEGRPTVFVPTDGGAPRKLPVEIGMDNGRVVHILGGVEAGTEVLLTPPLGESVTPIAGGATPEGAPPEGTPEVKPPEGQPQKAPVDMSNWQNMSREERRKAMENMTDEQREQLRQQMRQRFGGAGGEGRRRRRPRTGDGEGTKTPEE
jgi:HlyD family secretion protein